MEEATKAAVVEEQQKQPEAVKVFTSLADINALCQEKKRVEFDFNGKKCALEMVRLTPAQEAQIAEIIELVVPPIIKGATPDLDRVNTTDKDFIKRRQEASIKARAVALYWSFPAFQQMQPGLTDHGAISNFIQGQLTEAVLAVLWTATRDQGVGTAELVNFFS